jgi:hypothetical protein
VQAQLDQYGGPLATTFMRGRWYLDWIEQDGRRLSMRDAQGNYLDGYTVWRFVRGLEAGRLDIGIERRDAPAPGPAPMVALSGYRRQYVNEAACSTRHFVPVSSPSRCAIRGLTIFAIAPAIIGRPIIRMSSSAAR